MEPKDRSETIEFINKFEKFPTREDIKSAQELLQSQLDRRFQDVEKVANIELEQRDKAVEVLAKTLEQQVLGGDENLRQHIAQQIKQIELALEAAYKLMEARLGTLDQQIKSVHREIDIETAATKTAIQKAEMATEKRFESVNEFRAQMADQSALFISRREVEATIGGISEKVSAITDRINRSEGKGSGMSQIIAWIFGSVGLVVGLIAIFTWLSQIEPRVDRNSEFRQKAEPIIQRSNP